MTITLRFENKYVITLLRICYIHIVYEKIFSVHWKAESLLILLNKHIEKIRDVFLGSYLYQ